MSEFCQSQVFKSDLYADKALKFTSKSIPQVYKNWNFSTPLDPNQKCWLLTIGGIATIGFWSGKLGEHFSAWATL